MAMDVEPHGRAGNKQIAGPHDCTDLQPIRTFHLLRLEDESGVSGTGCVAEGAVFSNGWVALMWVSETPSVAFYQSIEAVEAVHGHGGKTRLVFQ
jgi:hypothetical protein